jgi:transposase-like protein
VVNVKEKTLFKFDIRCPSCNRKLMILNLSNFNRPQVRVLERGELGIHNTETRCPICKSFVAVDMNS